MALNAVLSGVLVGGRSRSYDGFEDDQGRTVPAGRACAVQLADVEGFPALVSEVKVTPAEYDTLTGAGFGVEVTLRVAAYGRAGGRVELRCIELLGVGAAA